MIQIANLRLVLVLLRLKNALISTTVFAHFLLMIIAFLLFFLDGIRPGLIDWPPTNIEADVGTTVHLTWGYTLTPKDNEHFDQINFGLCLKEKLTESLITVTKFVEDNSTKFEYNVTEKYKKRLRWVGVKGKISFELSNVTKKDANSYIMVMSFGSTREPISDHVELVVNCELP